MSDTLLYIPNLPLNPILLANLALADAEKIRQDERYEFDMRAWHIPNKYRNKCVVCVAGAIIANSAICDPRKFLRPGYFEYNTAQKLRAVDLMRTGKSKSALKCLCIDHDNCSDLCTVGDSNTYKGAVANINACIAEFRRIGIKEEDT